ncbi:MAG: hypothetical protein HY735_19095 [Verrucomicrobia bacterium]|nr:hypothetical protein [Verrucomicrobiota bacterium]
MSKSPAPPISGSRTEKRVCDLFGIKARFLRSAQLERDFDDPGAFSGYVVTDFTRSCLERMAAGLKLSSGQRAWRTTGDYGSGKSSFALLLAHLLAGHESSLPPQIRQAVDLSQFGVACPRFVPVLVTCARQSLGLAIVRGLQRTLSRLYKRGAKSRLALEVGQLLDNNQEPTDDQVLDLILETSSRLLRSTRRFCQS